jgi:hypothetical protein
MEVELAVALISGGIAVASWLYSYRTQRSLVMLQDRLDKERQQELARYEARLEEQSERKERIREEVLRWANPVFGAVQGLERRLDNILNDNYYLALRETDEERPVDPDWAVSYEYALPTTLFLFAEYFAWVRLLQERLSFELFESEETKERFFAAMWQVSKALSSWPKEEVTGSGPDAQVFALQQRALGELVIQRGAGDPRPMSLPEFLEAYGAGRDAFPVLLKPLRDLVEDVRPKTKRWARLSLVHKELREFEDECKRLLRVGPAE